MKMMKVGVLLDSVTARKRRRYGLNVFEAYIEEILAHAGVPFTMMTQIDDLPAAKVDLVIASVVPEDEQTAEVLWHYAEQGGILVTYGGLALLAERLGCVARSRLDKGYARLPEYDFLTTPLRYLSAEAWRTEGEHAVSAGSLHASSPDGTASGALLQQWTVGQGAIHRWAVDIPTTVVHLQQGVKPVLVDGIPAPDGTAAIDEGILKADDGMELDWKWDREHTETGMPYFAYPYADYWRQVLLSHLIRCAFARGLTLPLLDEWPDGIDRVALISFDSDFNLDETAVTTLDVLKEIEVPSTWCMIEPGYSSSVYDRVNGEGHELALHYNALEKEEGIWGREAFNRQLQWAQVATGVKQITSNKNHYTRYEGWGELFEWCEANGIAVDQTRGPTKRGNVGFLFGTCQPYFPIGWFDEENRLYDVLEVGFLTQDLNHPSLSDTTIIEPLLEQVAYVGGVAHFLFHQIHIHQLEPVREAIREVAEKAKRSGFTFWTSKQVNDWQRERRTIRIVEIDDNGKVQLNTGAVTKPITVWVPRCTASAEEAPDASIYRLGVLCSKQVY